MNYTITPIFLGSVDLDKGDSLKGTPHGVPLKVVYSCFVLRDEKGEPILVDSGLMSQKDIREQQLPYRAMDDAPDLLDALRLAGVDPEEIKTCILTHLHYDHACNLRLLPSLEKIYVQQKEILYALAPEKEDYRLYMLGENCGRIEWLDGVGKFVIVDGDVPIREGIDVILTPGHSRGSQCVLVDTAEGKYILTGDTVAQWESFEKRIPNSISFDDEIWHASCEKIAAAGAKLLPSHEVGVFERKVYG